MVLSVSAIGSEPLYYKWKKNGEGITDPECTGANTPTLTIDSFSNEHQGMYSCIVNNKQASIESNSANLSLGNSSYVVIVLKLSTRTNSNFENCAWPVKRALRRP